MSNIVGQSADLMPWSGDRRALISPHVDS